MKKAQGLSLNTIVIAAIALVVLLIVLALIFGTSNKVIPFLGKQSQCDARGGQCSDEKCTDVKLYGLGCPDAKPVCCVKQAS